MKESETIQITWPEEKRTLTLGGEPVLEYSLSWPEVIGSGRGVRRIDRYYKRLSDHLKRRWEREIYWRACLDLAVRRENARPFIPWRARISGEMTYCEKGMVSFRFTGMEIRGDGWENKVQWGDTWSIQSGTPCQLREVCSKARGWQKDLWQEVLLQGERRRQAGDCFLDRDWQKKICSAHILKNWCLTPEGIEFALPQGIAAPCAEGCLTFTVKYEAVLEGT